MNRAELLFKVVDLIYHRSQNCILFEDVISQKNISYGEDKLNKLDIYYCESNEKKPVLFNIHGGGFVAGDKKHRVSIGHIFAKKGWFVVNINYRLSPKNPFPSPLEDCFNAYNSLISLRDEYNLDLSKVVLTGDSSGGYFAVQMIAVLSNPGLRKRLSLPESTIFPAGVMGLFGPYDLLTAVNSKLPFGMVRSVIESFLGIKTDKTYECLKNYKYITDMAPINHVNHDWCPVLLAYAEQDFFCAGHAEMLFNKLKENGIYVIETHSSEYKDNHCYHLSYKKERSIAAFQKFFEFLEMIRSDGPTKQ